MMRASFKAVCRWLCYSGATQHSLGVLRISNTCCATEAGPKIVHMDRMPCNKRCAEDDFNTPRVVRMGF